MNWTDERVEVLKKLWADMLTVDQITERLGGTSRNAVISKVHRLKLIRVNARGMTEGYLDETAKTKNLRIRSRGHQTKSPKADKAQGAPPKKTPPKPRQIEGIVVPKSRNLGLVDLTEHTCKWPNGDPISEAFCFCGNESGNSGPYCVYHSRIAYQPVGERRSLR